VIVRVPQLIEILRRWNAVEPLLRRAMDRAEAIIEPEDVVGQVCSGRSTMLFVEDDLGALRVVVVTELRLYPRRRVLDVSWIGGADNATGLTEWAPLLVEFLEEMGRQNGCSMLSGTGRIGWSRVGGFKLRGGYATRIIPERPADVEIAKPNGHANGHQYQPDATSAVAIPADRLERGAEPHHGPERAAGDALSGADARDARPADRAGVQQSGKHRGRE